MSASKKQSKCTIEGKCDFCKSTIKRGDIMITSKVYDEYGRYTVRHHFECDRTADLTRVARGF